MRKQQQQQPTTKTKKNYQNSKNVCRYERPNEFWFDTGFGVVMGWEKS